MLTLLDLAITGALIYIAVYYGWPSFFVCLGFVLATIIVTLGKAAETK